eukprot:4173515-Amphidinium_carterae.3
MFLEVAHKQLEEFRKSQPAIVKYHKEINSLRSKLQGKAELTLLQCKSACASLRVWEAELRTGAVTELHDMWQEAIVQKCRSVGPMHELEEETCKEWQGLVMEAMLCFPQNVELKTTNAALKDAAQNMYMKSKLSALKGKLVEVKAMEVVSLEEMVKLEHLFAACNGYAFDEADKEVVNVCFDLASDWCSLLPTSREENKREVVMKLASAALPMLPANERRTALESLLPCSKAAFEVSASFNEMGKYGDSTDARVKEDAGKDFVLIKRLVVQLETLELTLKSVAGKSEDT